MSRAEITTPSSGRAGKPPEAARSEPEASEGGPLRVPLASLLPGTCGLVESVDASTPLGRRLADLGFLPRTEVRVLRRAPLGDPIEYELRGYRLCMRRAEAARVLVVPVDPRTPPAP
jgi:Fe2+ transport system protein FeoA